MSELIEYRKARISELTLKYNNDCKVEVDNYNKKIAFLLKTRPINIQQQIIIARNVLSASTTTLKNKYNKDVFAMQQYTPPSISVNKAKKALLIGINYIGTASELSGCINDAMAIKERIMSKGFSDITVITDLTTPKKPVKATILSEFKKLLVNAKAGDFLFFAYSGHGSYTTDKNGDELDGCDELICTLDKNKITDDELKTIIQKNLKKDVTLFAMFDSCFSGSVLDLRYQYMDSLNFDAFTENSKDAVTAGNVFMISGCTDEQTSADAFINDKATGAMTWAMLETLQEKEKEKENDILLLSWRDLLKTMRDKLKASAFDQIPQFSSGSFVDIDMPVFI